MYEPTPSTFSVLQKNTSGLRDVILRNCGVGGEAGEIDFMVDSGSANHVTDSGKGGITIPVVSLDDDISHPVSFIKMDIEGYEVKALRGAKNHIINDKPQLVLTCNNKRYNI